MTCETVSIRMNRSDPSIQWGFGFRQQSDKLLISHIDKDSLSDKAGLKVHDQVNDILGRNAQGMSISEANRLIEGARFEVNMNLQRIVTTHQTLPWTLTEKDNKLIVDDVRPIPQSTFARTGSSFSNSANQRSQWENTQRSIPLHSTQSNYSKEQRESSERRSQSQSLGTYNPNVITHHSPTQYSRHESSSYTRSETAPGQAPISYSTHSSSNYNSADHQNNSSSFGNLGASSFPAITSGNRVSSAPFSTNYGSGVNQGTNYSSALNQSSNYNSSSAPFGGSGGHNSRATDFGSNYRESTTGYPTKAGAGAGAYGSSGSGSNFNKPAQSYSYNNGATTTAYNPGSGGIPLNQNTFIQTGNTGAYNKQASLSPGGAKVLYHSPSSRTRRELSPNASIQHLQYNSPMNLYSTEAAADQYTQQTGRNVERLRNTQSPAYLNSETRRLIEEQEQGRGRGASPAHQSSSFKRISNAVGAPVN